MNQETISNSHAEKTHPVTTAINILTAPGEAFTTIRAYPTKLFPVSVVLLSLMAVMFWYFSIVDFDWYVDNTLAQANLSDAQHDEARERMLSMSQTNFMLLGMVGAGVGILAIWMLQTVYLTLVSALRGDDIKFTHWFSLVAWTGLTSLVSVLGMCVNILLNTNGQLSNYDLDPLTLANLGMQSSNSSIEMIFNAINLTVIWSLILMMMAYRQWLQSGWVRAVGIVLGPYILIIGVLAYFAIT